MRWPSAQRRLLLLLLAVLAAGCTTTQEIRRHDGAVEYRSRPIGGEGMKPPFVAAKSSKPSLIDQVLLLPGAVLLCILLPIAAFFGQGGIVLRRWPLTTWLLIGLGLLLCAILERFAVIIAELRAITFLCTNLFKDAEAANFLSTCARSAACARRCGKRWVPRMTTRRSTRVQDTTTWIAQRSIVPCGAPGTWCAGG